MLYIFFELADMCSLVDGIWIAAVDGHVRLSGMSERGCVVHAGPGVWCVINVFCITVHIAILAVFV